MSSAAERVVRVQSRTAIAAARATGLALTCVLALTLTACRSAATLGGGTAARPAEAASASSGASAGAGAGAGAGANQLSRAQRDSGWVLLFDGRSLAGWHGLGHPRIPAEHWTVEDGAIKKVASAKVPLGANGRRVPGGDLISDAAFGNFELAWEWKVTPAGNSGVKYNVSEELSLSAAPHSATGFEYQMLDDDRHSDGRLPTHRSGALYDLFTPNESKQLAPVGEWNRSAIVFDGERGEHWLNGRRVVEYRLGSPAMNAALAASKYASIPWFATRRTGHIVLQDHGDEVYFRSIRIRELKSPR